MLKKILTVVLCAVMVLGTVAYAAAEIKDGDTAYVAYGGTVSVTKNPTYSGGIAEVSKGTKVTVLEAYVIGEDNRKFHKIQLSDGTVGYILAYETARVTKPILEAAETAEKELNKQWETSDSDKYQHAIDMTFLSDYIYGGSKTTEGNERNFYAKVPTEWVRHDRPASLPLVGMAVLHIGDEGKIGSVKASFYPGNPPINYHIRRLDELREIGYEPLFSEWTRTDEFANTAFYATTTSEFEVVAYNEDWVAVWSEGGVDESRGSIRQCGEKDGTAFTSWKPGVYFFPRKNCYILDINNQVSTPPKIEAVGRATGLLTVKTTPDDKDYVKSGIIKINQSVQIADAAPQNGHYKIYYKKGLYYVNSKYVNAQLANTEKPATQYKAIAASDCDISDGASIVGSVKKGAAIDVTDKDYDGTNSKIWFNSKECYIPTSKLDEFTKTLSAADTAALGAPIGVLSVDTPWGEWGALTYSAEGIAKLKKYRYGYINVDENMMSEYTQWVGSNNGDINKIHDREWVNVYGIEEFSFDRDEDMRDIPGIDPSDIEPWIITGKIYTIFYDGEIRYLVHEDDQHDTFTYYPGNGFSKNSVAKTQTVCLDGLKYDTVAYNIDDNNYFKLRDIAKILDGTIKSFDIEYDAATNSIDMLSFYDYTAAGGELTPGDGTERTALSSSVFVTLDGVPIKATCYNIEGNNYFKLRDITDALDCRVEWDENTQMIWVIPARTAFDDPDEIMG
ncbi:MAG: hypothetical protein SPL89_00420 [Clostridia bacterium]|nr:hypothetical protein [Clostridia bacterium]